MSGTKLVMGASGFLGSHVTRQLAERGDTVRVWIRRSSSTQAFDDLPVERCHGDLSDDDELRAAMRGVETVFYCIVDTRAWLRDPAPLYEANVAGLRHVLDAAVEMRVPRFVFCSTVGTIAVTEDGLATEDLPHNWTRLGGDYIKSRVAAEELVLRYSREHGLPAVILCVSTTFGPRDWGPSPHGGLVAAAAKGKVPVYVRDAALEVVGVEDAARAFLLAEERGRPGERYIVSERYMSAHDILTTASDAVGAKPPRWGVPLVVVRLAGVVGEVVARVLRRDMPLTRVSVRLMHFMSPLDHGKASRELGWEPSPAADAIRAAARFFVARDSATMRR